MPVTRNRNKRFHNQKGNKMSETTATVETNSQPNSEKNSVTETQEITRNPGLIDPAFYEGMYQNVVKLATEHNNKAQQIQDAGDRVAIMDSLRANPEQTNDSDFVELAKRRAELSDALEAAEKAFAEKSEPFIQEHLKRSGVETLQSEADELAKQVKATTQFMNAMGATIEGIPALKNRAGRSSSTGDGRGSGIPKYRNLEVYVDGKRAEQKINVKNKDGSVTGVLKSNLTYGANAAGVPSDVFRAAFVKAQGTDDAANFKDRVEFIVNDGTKDHSVVVQKMPAE